MRYGLLLLLLLNACTQTPTRPAAALPDSTSPLLATTNACQCAEPTLPPLQIPDVERWVPPTTSQPGELPKSKQYQRLHPAEWNQLTGFEQDDLTAAWPALERSCVVLSKNEAWKPACAAVLKQTSPGKEAARALLLEQFQPWQVTNPDGSNTGLITGYYEPLLKGSRSRSERYRYPLYARPDDLISVELGGLYPELSSRKLRGRLDGNRLKPYYSRGEIEVTPSPLAGNELLWTDDIVELFFLQIQGSGLVKLDSGESVHVGYADQNGQPYQSIGKILIDQGELMASQASMQGIKAWGRNNIGKLRDLLNSNPSYVFFRELPNDLPGPLGALGVPIVGERSIAVDPRYIPLGAPVFLATTYPNSQQPLQRLMLAQDTGGAIKGAVRADFFWGAGNLAGKQAGAMKQQGRMWVLLPKGSTPY